MNTQIKRFIISHQPVSARLPRLIAGLVITLLMSGCDEPRHAAPPAPPLVRTIAVPAAVPSAQINWSGKLIAGREVSLGFRTAGRLAERRVDVGARVSRDTVLARLDATQSREQVMSARAALSEADAQLRKSQQDAERIRRLVEIGTAPRARLQEATSSLAAAQARRDQAAAQLSEASNGSDFNLLQAPFDGVVTAVSAEPGQALSQGQEIMQFASDKDKKLILNLPQAFANSLRQEDKLRVEFDNGTYARATVLTVSPQSDPQTLLIAVKAALDEKDVSVPLGSVLTGSVIQDSDRVSVIPAAALTRKGDSPAVYVVLPKTSTLELRPVSIRYYRGDTAAVSDGLSAGEQIATAGVSRLTPGMKITVQDGTQ